MDFGDVSVLKFKFGAKTTTKTLATTMMEYETTPAIIAVPPAVACAKVLTRREEIDSGIPWVEKYRPQRYVMSLGLSRVWL